MSEMNEATLPPVDQLIDQLQVFMDTHIYPNEQQYHEQLHALENRFATVPLMQELKAKAKAEGLWNLWMPRSHGGLSNADYCPLAEMMGRVLWSPEVFNCNAPDTGNMEVFLKYATEEQKAQWLEPLLEGEIRSSYCMTEPDVASSDATFGWNLPHPVECLPVRRECFPGRRCRCRSSDRTVIMPALWLANATHRTIRTDLNRPPY